METFTIGHFRPLHLWAGPGTIRMNRLRYMNANVDDGIHALAHDEDGAERVAAMGFNWVYLACNWGFPPEIEETDWLSFERAVKAYHAAGIQVFGSVQTSNCVYSGSYVDKEWYALDPAGRKISFQSGRFLTCLHHEGWLAEVQAKIKIVAEAGADGIFFNNLLMGGLGRLWRGIIVGARGCYHPATRDAYGKEIPTVLDTRDAAVQHYLNWRTESITTRLKEWSDYARSLKPDLKISAGLFDVINRNSAIELGIDLQGIVDSDSQDVFLVENFALPRLQNNTAISNAVVIGATLTRTQKPVASLPTEKGVGFDPVWKPASYERMLLEAVAMNNPVTVKGSEYLHRGQFTTLLHTRYSKQQTALTRMNQWLTTHIEWLGKRTQASELAIYFPYESLRWSWDEYAPYFFGACETLFRSGLPFRVVGDDDPWQDVKVLVMPLGHTDGIDKRLADFTAGNRRLIALGQKRPGANVTIWQDYVKPTRRVPRPTRRIATAISARVWEAYHRTRLGHRFGQRIADQILASNPYLHPPAALQGDLRGAIGWDFLPRLTSDAPVLFTLWREPDGREQYHIVNYANRTQQVTLHLPDLQAMAIYTPGSTAEPTVMAGSELILSVDTAKVIRRLDNSLF